MELGTEDYYYQEHQYEDTHHEASLAGGEGFRRGDDDDAHSGDEEDVAMGGSGHASHGGGGGGRHAVAAAARAKRREHRIAAQNATADHIRMGYASGGASGKKAGAGLGSAVTAAALRRQRIAKIQDFSLPYIVRCRLPPPEAIEEEEREKEKERKAKEAMMSGGSFRLPKKDGGEGGASVLSSSSFDLKSAKTDADVKSDVVGEASTTIASSSFNLRSTDASRKNSTATTNVGANNSNNNQSHAAAAPPIAVPLEDRITVEHLEEIMLCFYDTSATVDVQSLLQKEMSTMKLRARETTLTSTIKGQQQTTEWQLNRAAIDVVKSGGRLSLQMSEDKNTATVTSATTGQRNGSLSLVSNSFKVGDGGGGGGEGTRREVSPVIGSAADPAVTTPLGGATLSSASHFSGGGDGTNISSTRQFLMGVASATSNTGGTIKSPLLTHAASSPTPNLSTAQKMHNLTRSRCKKQLTEEQFVEALQSVLGPYVAPRAECRSWFRQIDYGDSGSIGWEEFSSYLLSLGEHRTHVENRPLALGIKLYPTSCHLWNRHSSPITCCLVHPVTGVLYTGGEDGLILGWHATSLRNHTLVHRGSSWVIGLHLMHDGRLAAATVERELLVFDLKSNEMIRCYKGKCGLKGEMGMSYAYSAGTTISVNEKLVGHLTPRNAKVTPNRTDNKEKYKRLKSGASAYVPMSKDEAAVISKGAKEDRTNETKQLEQGTLLGLEEAPTCVDYHFSAVDQDLFFFGTRSGAVVIYDITNTHDRVVRQFYKLQPHKKRVNKVEIIPLLECMLTCSDDCTLKLTSMETGLAVREFAGHSMGVTTFVYSQPCRIFISISGERRALVWDYLQDTPIYALEEHNAPLLSACVNETERQIITLSADNTVRISDLMTHKTLQTMSHKNNASSKMMANATGGGSSDGTSVHDKDQIPNFTLMYYDQHRHRHLVFSTFPQIYKLRQSEYVFPLHYSGHVEPVVHMAAYNTSFRQLVSFDADTCIVWDCASGTTRFSYPYTRDFSSAIEDFKLTATGWDDTQRRLIAGYHQGTVVVWNYSNGQALNVIQDTSIEHMSRYGSEVSAVCATTVGDTAVYIYGVGRKLLYCAESQQFTVQKANSFVLPEVFGAVTALGKINSHLIVIGTSTGALLVYNLSVEEAEGKPMLVTEYTDGLGSGLGSPDSPTSPHPPYSLNHTHNTQQPLWDGTLRNTSIFGGDMTANELGGRNPSLTNNAFNINGLNSTGRSRSTSMAANTENTALNHTLTPTTARLNLPSPLSCKTPFTNGRTNNCNTTNANATHDDVPITTSRIEKIFVINKPDLVAPLITTTSTSTALPSPSAGTTVFTSADSGGGGAKTAMRDANAPLPSPPPLPSMSATATPPAADATATTVNAPLIFCVHNDGRAVLWHATKRTYICSLLFSGVNGSATSNYAMDTLGCETLAYSDAMGNITVWDLVFENVSLMETLRKHTRNPTVAADAGQFITTLKETIPSLEHTSRVRTCFNAGHASQQPITSVVVIPSSYATTMEHKRKRKKAQPTTAPQTSQQPAPPQPDSQTNVTIVSPTFVFDEESSTPQQQRARGQSMSMRRATLAAKKNNSVTTISGNNATDPSSPTTPSTGGNGNNTKDNNASSTRKSLFAAASSLTAAMPTAGASASVSFNLADLLEKESGATLVTDDADDATSGKKANATNATAGANAGGTEDEGDNKGILYYQPTIATCGADCSVRLWTIDGWCIGEFGMKRWSLEKTLSWKQLHADPPVEGVVVAGGGVGLGASLSVYGGGGGGGASGGATPSAAAINATIADMNNPTTLAFNTTTAVTAALFAATTETVASSKPMLAADAKASFLPPIGSPRGNANASTASASAAAATATPQKAFHVPLKVTHANKGKQTLSYLAPNHLAVDELLLPSGPLNASPAIATAHHHPPHPATAHQHHHLMPSPPPPPPQGVNTVVLTAPRPAIEAQRQRGDATLFTQQQALGAAGGGGRQRGGTGSDVTAAASLSFADADTPRAAGNGLSLFNQPSNSNKANTTPSVISIAPTASTPTSTTINITTALNNANSGGGGGLHIHSNAFGILKPIQPSLHAMMTLTQSQSSSASYPLSKQGTLLSADLLEGSGGEMSFARGGGGGGHKFYNSEVLMREARRKEEEAAMAAAWANASTPPRKPQRPTTAEHSTQDDGCEGDVAEGGGIAHTPAPPSRSGRDSSADVHAATGQGRHKKLLFAGQKHAPPILTAASPSSSIVGGAGTVAVNSPHTPRSTTTNTATAMMSGGGVNAKAPSSSSQQKGHAATETTAQLMTRAQKKKAMEAEERRRREAEDASLGIEHDDDKEAGGNGDAEDALVFETPPFMTANAVGADQMVPLESPTVKKVSSSIPSTSNASAASLITPRRDPNHPHTDDAGRTSTANGQKRRAKKGGGVGGLLELSTSSPMFNAPPALAPSTGPGLFTMVPAANGSVSGGGGGQSPTRRSIASSSFPLSQQQQQPSLGSPTSSAQATPQHTALLGTSARHLEPPSPMSPRTPHHHGPPPSSPLSPTSQQRRGTRTNNSNTNAASPVSPSSPPSIPAGVRAQMIAANVVKAQHEKLFQYGLAKEDVRRVETRIHLAESKRRRESSSGRGGGGGEGLGIDKISAAEALRRRIDIRDGNDRDDGLDALLVDGEEEDEEEDEADDQAEGGDGGKRKKKKNGGGASSEYVPPTKLSDGTETILRLSSKIVVVAIDDVRPPERSAEAVEEARRGGRKVYGVKATVQSSAPTFSAPGVGAR